MNSIIKLLFICCFIHGQSKELTAQVYISNCYDGDIFVGPDNVFPLSKSVIETYTVELEDIIYFLDSLYMASLKTDQENTDNIMEMIHQDIEFMQKLLVEWDRVDLDKWTLGEELCFYHEDLLEYEAVKLKTRKKKSVEVTERISPKIIQKKPTWEKKKADRNCLSYNPNDCLVWCLVDNNKYIIEGIAGKNIEINSDDQNFDFTIDIEKDVYNRFLTIELKSKERVYFFDSEELENIPISKIQTCPK